MRRQYMLQYHIFPGGKRRVLTFSYDDGHPNDERLLAIFAKYGIKGTFHLNSAYLAAGPEALRTRYAGQEVACHTVHHGWPARMPSATVIQETIADRAALEEIFGCPVQGMSYPSGSYDAASAAAMRAAGILYSRTTKSTGNFYLPEDFMAWHPSCHHRDAMPLCERFLADIDSEWTHPLFYIWGHSFEFRSEADWKWMEDLLSTLGGQDKIWYATNGQIYTYLTALQQLRVSVDEKIIENPTATDVWVEKDKKEIYCIPAGKRLSLR